MSDMVPICPHVRWDNTSCGRSMTLLRNGQYSCDQHGHHYDAADPTLQWRQRTQRAVTKKELGPQWGWMRIEMSLYEATERARDKIGREEGDKPLSRTEIVSRALAAYPPVVAELKEQP